MKNYSDFLNYFDSSVSAQLSAINRNADIFALEKAVEIPVRDDESRALSIEYGNIMRSQRTKGNNGLAKKKYITYGIHADNLKAAKLRLERVETDVLNNLKTIGVTSHSLNGMVE